MHYLQIALILCLGLIVGGANAAACDAPSMRPPAINTDALDDEAMLFVKAKVLRYLEEHDSYIDCLDAMEKTALGMGHESDQRRRQRIARYNEAMADMSRVVNEFNAQVERFNAGIADNSAVQ